MIDNPYWDICEPHAEPSGERWEGPQVAGFFVSRRRLKDDPNFAERMAFWEKRRELTSLYSWSIPDPPSVKFVVEMSRGKLLDPIAGTGYWTYLLAQSGVDCAAYDSAPPTSSTEDNMWHRHASAFMAVLRADAVAAVAALTFVDSSPTLFLSWPPYESPLAYEILKAYRGDRVIYIGEGAGGCTADDDFHELLDKEWTEVDFHLIAQWGGIHDRIWVYDRNR